MANHTPEEMIKRHKEWHLACEAVDKHWKETEFHEDDTKNESEFAEHEKSWKGGYVHGWMEKYTRTSNLECQLATVTAQRDELQARLDTELANGWQSKWHKAIQCGAAIERQRDTLKAQRDELLELLKSSLSELKIFVFNSEWQKSDFPVIARAESAIDKCEAQNG